MVEPEVLFATTVPADHLPPNPVWIDVYRMEWDSGARWPYDEAYRSTRIWCVEAGEFALRPEGRATIFRAADRGTPPAAASGPPEPIPPGTGATLSPGDCVVIRADAPYESWNPGSEPLVTVCVPTIAVLVWFTG